MPCDCGEVLVVLEVLMTSICQPILLLHSYLTEYCRPSPNCSIYECIAYSGCVTSVNCRMQNFINISKVMAVRTDELGKASSVFLGGFECGLCFYKDKPT